MKRLLFFCMVLLSVFSLHATRRALVIGIGDYPEESGCKKINGDKDIPLVMEILATNGFEEQNIVTLQNHEATCAAILQGLENMITMAQAGDYLYIHFSGHGQQITDLDGDEDDHKDEAWLPYDAQATYVEDKYEGQNHIIDDQLNRYLHRMREKVGETGKILVVADACHSGSGSRDLDDDDTLVVRGVFTDFVISKFKKPKQASAVNYPIEWTFVSACKSYQSNYEYQGKGSLTYALYQEKDNFSILSTDEMEESVKKCIRDILPVTQTPLVEFTKGANSEKFF